MSVSERPEACLLLQSETWREDLLAAEQTFGRPLPPVVQMVLTGWNERGAQVLLEEVPCALNPKVGPSVLNPTGKDMHELFPEFCTMLEHTEHFAVVVDVVGGEQILFAGLARDVPTDRMQRWAYYAPIPLETLHKCEQQLGASLDKQLRQMYLRAGGTTNAGICPYFYPPDALERGWLYDDLYRDMIGQVPLDAEIIGRLQSFVAISANITGDIQGFFVNERRHDNEYTIYEWDHERLEFTMWAKDFSEAMTRKLAGFW